MVNLSDIYKVGNIIKRTFVKDGVTHKEGEIEIFEIIGIGERHVMGKQIYDKDKETYPRGWVGYFYMTHAQCIWRDEICPEKELIAYLI